jgi:CRISP-associated protein Cas1
MTDRIIDISDSGAFLKVENKLLVIRLKDGNKTTIPLVDVGLLLLSNKAITLTHSVLSRLSEAGAIVLVSDDKHLPSAMMLPLQSNSIQTERIRIQTEATQPVKKQLWKQIIMAKINNQGELLKKVSGDDAGLLKLKTRVRSGDPDNIEARAAVIYWKTLGVFSKRERFADDANRFFNYGYAVLNALCARALCASGLHLSLGIHHHNQYNSFCLASDIMEPFRPLVDETVMNIVNKYGADAEMNREMRSDLISTATKRVLLDCESVPLFYAVTRIAGSLVNCLSGKSKKLTMPENIFIKRE